MFMCAPIAVGLNFHGVNCRVYVRVFADANIIMLNTGLIFSILLTIANNNFMIHPFTSP